MFAKITNLPKGVKVLLMSMVVSPVIEMAEAQVKKASLKEMGTRVEPGVSKMRVLSSTMVSMVLKKITAGLHRLWVIFLPKRLRSLTMALMVMIA